MDTSKIIRGVVSSGRYTVTAPIVKEDYGLYLKIEGVELPSTYEVDFSNSESSGTSVTMIGNSDGVLIPRQFIDSGKDVFAFLYHVGEDFGRTVFKFRIPNKLRPDRTNEEPTPEEQSVIDQVIASLNDAVGEAKDAQQAIENMSVSAQTLAEGATATVTKTESEGVVHLEFGIPKGQTGDSPTITASKTGKTTSIYVDGSEVAQIEDGTDGIDGISPSVSVTDITGGHRVVITDKDGEKSFDVEDGATGATPNLTIGTVETLESTESATASITGTPENPVLNLGIPQGEQGEVTLEEFYKAFPTDTASGAVASFSDGADGLPLKSLVVNIDPVQDLSNGDPSPENICPISGWTGCEIQHDGTNLFDGEMENGDINQYTGENNGTSSSRYRSKNYIPIRIGSYYFKSPNRTGTVRVFSYDKDKTFLRITAWNVNEVNAVNNADTRYIRFRFATGKVDGDEQISINSPSSVTDYAPYQGATLPISWQTEAGTVYGGTLDVLSGKLTVVKGYKATTWGEMETMETLDDRINKRVALGFTPVTGALNNICNVAPYKTNSSELPRFVTNTNGYTYVTLPLGVDDSTPVQIVSKMATPIEIQLDAHTINSLYGQNNIFADTGDTSCEYRADTKLYIERLTAPDSADMIADANITSGKYFMVGNSLYKATANIANGAQIIVGTNCIRKSLSEALNEINA